MPLLNPNQIKTVANHQKFTFKTELGQHFLVNNLICKLIVDSLEIQKDQDSILEIGPGFGAFSHILAENVNSLYLVEISKKCSRYLEREMKRNYNTNRIEQRQIQYLGKIPQKSHITIIEGDILAIPWPKVTKIISNLPFSITYPLLIRFLTEWDYTCGVFIIQDEVYQTMMKTSKDYGYGVLSVLTEFFLEIKIVKRLISTDFFPPPKVNTNLIKILPKETLNTTFLAIEDRKEFILFVQALFKNKNIIMRNNIKKIQATNPHLMNRHPHLIKTLSDMQWMELNVKSFSSFELFQLFKKSQ